MTADFPDYDAGLININGGSDVDWWLDYIRSEIGRANDHWRDEMTAANAREAALVDAFARSSEREAALRDALEWYAEQTRLCRLIHSGGDTGRKALNDDGGARALSALAVKP